MRVVSLALLALLSVPMTLAVSTPAVAQTQSDCQAMIANLRAASSTVAISGKNADKDRAGLVGKLDAASVELAKGKNGDAVTKLGDFKTKVGQLAAAGRISATDASSLTAQADAAIACIAGLNAG